jgi:hypothetical protein
LQDVFITSLAALLAVHIKRAVAAFRDAASVVRELHSHLILAGRNDVLTLDGVVVYEKKVVTLLELAALAIEAEAAGKSALGNYY